jgi:hypothetical protein
MKHQIKMSKSEKIEAWFSLCDFSQRLLEGALSKKEIREKFERMREEHLKMDYKILEAFSKLEK